MRESGGDGIAVALHEIVAASVLPDLIGPETMGVRLAAARRLDPAGDGFTVRPQVVRDGRSDAQNESGGETATHGWLFLGGARGGVALNAQFPSQAGTKHSHQNVVARKQHQVGD